MFAVVGEMGHEDTVVYVVGYVNQFVCLGAASVNEPYIVVGAETGQGDKGTTVVNGFLNGY